MKVMVYRSVIKCSLPYWQSCLAEMFLCIRYIRTVYQIKLFSPLKQKQGTKQKYSKTVLLSLIFYEYHYLKNIEKYPGVKNYYFHGDYTFQFCHTSCSKITFDAVLHVRS